MTKQSIITADEARFPLSNLSLSPMNPRQNVPAAEVEDLAESIWTAGLIQNLAGIMDGKGGLFASRPMIAPRRRGPWPRMPPAATFTPPMKSGPMARWSGTAQPPQ